MSKLTKLYILNKFYLLYANYTSIKLQTVFWGRWKKFENGLEEVGDG